MSKGRLNQSLSQYFHNLLELLHYFLSLNLQTTIYSILSFHIPKAIGSSLSTIEGIPKGKNGTGWLNKRSHS